jgi:hypothetical protein
MNKYQFDEKTGTRKFSKDQEVELQIEELVRCFNITPLELLNGFPIYARRTTIKRFLAHYELFRKTVNLPGDIVELGVYRGLSLLSWANFLEARNIGDRTKKVWGFDNFTGLGEFSPEDGPEYPNVQKVPGGFNPAQYFEQLQEAIKIFDNDRFVPWKSRVELIIGNVEETVPRFIEENPGIRISLLHIDVDLYKPSIVGLKYLFPRVVRGGVVAFDDYASLEFGGESAAVDEFLASERYVLNKLDWNNVPGGYLVKD